MSRICEIRGDRDGSTPAPLPLPLGALTATASLLLLPACSFSCRVSEPGGDASIAERSPSISISR